MSNEQGESLRWVPLESNPEVLTKYCRSLGAKNGEWLDVFSLDEADLIHIPKPVLAVMLLFPVSEGYDNFCKEQDEVVKEKGTAKEEELFYMKQFIPNACGTIGIIHALGNNVAQVDLADGTLLRQFLDSVRGKDPEAIGEELEKFQSIATAHEEIANEGQTAAPNREDQILTHFVTFVHSNGNLFELDGRRKGPVNHGPTTPENLIKDAAVVCKARMERDPTEYRFTVVALTTGSIE